MEEGFTAILHIAHIAMHAAEQNQRTIMEDPVGSENSVCCGTEHARRGCLDCAEEREVVRAWRNVGWICRFGGQGYLDCDARFRIETVSRVPVQFPSPFSDMWLA